MSDQEAGEPLRECPRCGKERPISTTLASGIREVFLDCGYYGFGKTNRRSPRRTWGSRAALARRLPAKKRTGSGFAVGEDPCPRRSGDATDNSPAMPVQADLLPGRDLFRDLHTVSPSIGILEAESGGHTASIGVTA